MRTGEMTNISGAWSEQDNAWVSETLCLSGDSWLEVTIPDKGRLIIKKSESADGPFPKALISKWIGPDFRIRIFGTTENRYIRIYLTDTPTKIQITLLSKSL